MKCCSLLCLALAASLLADDPPPPTPQPPCCQKVAQLPASDTVSDTSIYQVDSLWIDHRGTKKPLKSLASSIQVVTMGYTSCQYACPRLLADMLAIESKLPKNLLKNVHFTFISIDPERDTPEQISKYLEKNELDHERWHVLTSTPESVQELAVLLGVKYRKSSETDFAHSNIITVLNKKGEIIHRLEGLGADNDKIITAIIEAVKDEAH